MISLSVPTGDPDDSDDEPFINCIAAYPSSRFLRIWKRGGPAELMSQLRRDAALPRRGDAESILLWRHNISTRRAGLLARERASLLLTLRSRSAVGLGRMLLTPKRLYDDYRLSFK
ncbi:hypothetical protein T190_08250 [Sinorhizobium meliloti CCBAU 01290]|nr:hypothetical protein T190_08250 [Sinorhizobium meliloti CCBAU 01290]